MIKAIKSWLKVKDELGFPPSYFLPSVIGLEPATSDTKPYGINALGSKSQIGIKSSIIK